MKNFQSINQKQGLRQLPLDKIIQFQKLLKANVQDLSMIVTSRLKNNIFFDGLADDPFESMESLSDVAQEHNNDYKEDLYDMGYKMQGDGRVLNEVPDDRKRYMATEESLMEELTNQLSTLQLSLEQKEIALFFIQSIDPNGFLSNQFNTVDFLINNSNHRGELVKSTLEYLKSRIEPAGVFAESIKESMQIQADRLPQSTVKMTLVKLLDHRYEDLIEKNLDGLKSYLHIDNYEVLSDVYQALGTFQPIPLQGGNVGNTFKTRKEPDFIVKEVNGSYVVKSTEKNIPEISVNEHYSKTLATLHLEKRFQDPEYTFLRDQRHHINEVKVMLKERQAILEKVVSYVLNTQSSFLENQDNEKIVPLLLKDTAEKFNLSPSTISRIASDKLVQTEEGQVIKLSEMFSLGVRTEAGMRSSIGEIKDKIRELIRTEDHNKPKTYLEIEKDLKGFGFIISSTNVRKMCDDMKIPESRHRKVDYHNARINNTEIGQLMKKWDLKPVIAVNETKPAAEQLKFKM